MKRIFFLLVTAAFSFLSCDLDGNYNSDYQTYRAIVKNVGDGQTVTVRFSDDKPDNASEWETIHLLGVSAEKITDTENESNNTTYAIIARNYLRSYKDAAVYIQTDSVSGISRDSEGNLYAYAWLDDDETTLLNENIIRRGYAYYDKSIGMDKWIASRLKAAEQYAKDNRLGVQW